MILPDVNVIIYAFRPEMDKHALCRTWLEKKLNEDVHFGMSPLVLSSVVRITTNPRIYDEPDDLSTVLNSCNRLLKRENCVLIQPGKRHWSIFNRLCLKTQAKGNLVADAWLAALAIEWDCEWITFDKDFARFEGLNWREPEQI